MRSEIKIGIVLGIVIVAAALVMIVGRNKEPQPTRPELAYPPPSQEQPVSLPPEESLLSEEKKEPPMPAAEAVPAPQEPAKQESVENPPLVPEPQVLTPRFHVVQKGDTLSKISEMYYGSEKFWKVIYQANADLIKNPNVLQFGWKLRIPYPEEVEEAEKQIKP